MGEFNVNKSDGSLEQTAGMPSEYPATQVMLSDGVTSVEDRISANSFETPVSIPAATNFTATSDGYVIGRCAAGASKQLTIAVNSEQVARAISTADFPMITNVFVKKGMIVSWTATDQANSIANFIAIS